MHHNFRNINWMKFQDLGTVEGMWLNLKNRFTERRILKQKTKWNAEVICVE